VDDWTPAGVFYVDRLARIAAAGSRQAITGRQRGAVWSFGALDLLASEGLAVVQRQAALYRVQVVRRLPLLTPTQAARLSPPTQARHRTWLREHGLDLERWAALAAPHLAPPPPDAGR
jgi:hypothetical protein